jgi:hypothetical protein
VNKNRDTAQAVQPVDPVVPERAARMLA